MRRRALLAASATSGGGKIVNHGTIILDIINTKLMWEYPLASNLAITISTNIGDYLIFGKMGSSTNSIALGPGETILSVVSIYPQEDNTYIYEIIL